MDYSRLLLVVVAASAGLALIVSLRQRAPGMRKWRALQLVVLGACGVGWALAPTVAGFVAAGAWLLLVVVPGALMLWVSRLVQQGRHSSAVRVLAVVRLLRPFGGAGDLSAFLAARLDLREGRVERARERLERLVQRRSPLRHAAHVELLAHEGRWQEVAEWVEAQLDPPKRIEPTLIASYVRALGEQGRLVDLCRVVEAQDALLHTGPMRLVRRQCGLFVLAFAGRVDSVERLAAGLFGLLERGVRELWIATAELAAGRDEAARQRIERQLATGETAVVSALERRLKQPIVRVSDLSVEDAAVVSRTVDRVERELDHEWRYGSSDVPRKRPRATLAIIALLVAVFVVEELAGGSTHEATLLSLGALSADLVVAGEWWRILTAQLLHFGPLHLAMNCLGLLVMGRFVEHSLGALRHALVFFVSGTLAMTTTVLLTTVGWSNMAVLIGASGGVMGTVGASIAILLRGWREERARVASRHLLIVTAIVVMQAVVDVLVPETSFVAHALGASFGFLVAGGMVRVTLRWLVPLGAAALAAAVLGERYVSSRACGPANVAACVERCEQGHARICGVVGDMYAEGIGVPRDTERAARAYRTACDGDVAAACNNLGTLFDSGAGVPVDPGRAARLFRKACDGGISVGCRNLALAELEGRGVPRNVDGARRRLRQLCDDGDERACDLLPH